MNSKGKISNPGGSGGISRTEDSGPGAEVTSMRTSTFEVGRLCERSRMGHGLASVVIARCRYLWRSGWALSAI